MNERSLRAEQAEISFSLGFLCFGLVYPVSSSGPIIQDLLSRKATKSGHGLSGHFGIVTELTCAILLCYYSDYHRVSASQ